VVYHLLEKDHFVVSGPARQQILELIDTHSTSLKAVATTEQWEGASNRNAYSTALRQAVSKWHVKFPFYRALGNLPSRGVRKPYETNDRLAFAIGTALFGGPSIDADVVLSLDLKPMVLPAAPDETTREMDEG